MKRYFSKEDFITFLRLLEVGKPTTLYVEAPHYEEEIEGEIDECVFLKVSLCGDDIIIYDTLKGFWGLIQDIPDMPLDYFEDEAYESLVCDGVNRIFIRG